jgi:splicing factor 3B subunit 3
MDSVTGLLSPDFRTRFMGTRPVKLFKIVMHGMPAVLALSSRSWLVYNYQGRLHVTPLSYETLEYGSGFSSDQCPEGLVCVAANTLRILTIQRLGEVFNQQAIKLAFTPRKMVLLNDSKCFVLIETDHNVDAAAAQAAGSSALDNANQEDDEEETSVPYQIFGVQRAGLGKWASCIRVLDPIEGDTKQVIDMWEDEAAVSVCLVKFHDRPGDQFVLVGTTTGMKLGDRSAEGCIHTYSVSGTQLTLLHKTTIDAVPRALCAFQGRVLVGAGKTMRLYDFGRRKLLRKCENRRFPCMIVSIQTQGERIFVGDVAESFFYAKYNRSTNSLFIFGDDTNARWLTAACCLDFDTLAGGDKFGNVFVCRLPAEAKDDAGEEPGAIGGYDHGNAEGARFKVNEIVQFHVGETVTSIQKCSLSPGGAAAIVYGTVGGGIGAMQPFVSRQDVDFFMHLEMHLRGASGAREVRDSKDEGGGYDHPSVCGRDQLSFRSSYFPVKDVIDGDLCETFLALDKKRQKTIADDLDRTPGEIAKKLEDMRNRLL